MGLFDRSGRRRPSRDGSGQEAGPTAGAPTTDAFALDRYERMLGSAPPATVERVHAEAFERLTATERDAVFERLAAGASTDDERPRDPSPAALARAASRAEAHRHGAIGRMLGTDSAGAALSTAVGGAILATVATYAAASAAWAAWAADGDEEPDGYGGTGGIGGFDF